jgi:hypothetical protein
MAFTQVTITASFKEADGAPADTGTVTATLSQPIQNGVDRIEPAPVVGVISMGGLYLDGSNAPFTLAANDDAGTTPQGSRYSFVIAIAGAPVEQFDAVVPHAVSPIDLSALDPL